MTENYADNLEEHKVALNALQWHVDHGADEALVDVPIDRTVMPDIAKSIASIPTPQKLSTKQEGSLVSLLEPSSVAPMGSVEAVAEAKKLAQACETLEALKAAIEGFDGLSVKKTAMNMVFSDGNPDSNIMLIGDAPAADDDIQGKPFRGLGGQLLDKILACIDLDRKSERAEGSVYISTVLNWRPPGNRTPTPAEMAISLPFIERHITLAQPKIIILCGGTVGQTLLKRSDSISKMRGSFHDYQVGGTTIPVMITYHPDYLLRTPSQKKAVWADMLMFQAKMQELDILL